MKKRNFIFRLSFLIVIILSCAEGPNLPTALYREWKGKILFASDEDGDYEIYIMNIDGSEKKQLTYNNNTDFFPVWSPDGNSIAFVSGRDGNAEIYVMDSRGENQRNLTNNSSFDTDPSWSPDGEKIVFGSDGDGDIYIMNADGMNVEKILDSSVHEWEPEWSPDGMKITFNSEMAIAGGGNDMIFIYDIAKESFYNLTPDTAYAYYSPAWSPDGKWLACNVLPKISQGFRYDIGIIDVSTGEIEISPILGENRAHSNLWGFAPLSWSSDGCMIALMAVDPTNEYNFDIYTIYADLSNPQRLTFSVANEIHPSLH